MNFPAAKIISLGDAIDKNGIPTGTGAVPPSQIPPSAEVNGKAVETQGVMTLVCLPGQAVTVRGSYITKPQLAAYAAKLPDRPANAEPRDNHEEEPLHSISAQRKWTPNLDSDAIKVDGLPPAEIEILAPTSAERKWSSSNFLASYRVAPKAPQ